MQLAIYFTVGLVVLWALYTGYMWLTSQSIRGQEISTLKCSAPELSALPEKALIYFFSPNCGPCKSMTPEINELIENGYPVIKVQIPERMELARELGVKATPTLLLVCQGRVEAVNIGAKTRTQILELLED